MKFSSLRSARAAWCYGVAATLFVGLVGCGGGGGGSNNSNSPTPTPSPTPTSAAGQCTATTYTPNYASSVDLVHWTGFPLRVYFVQDTQDSSARQNVALTGFNRWVTATNNRATYVVTQNKDAADVKVNFGLFTGGAGDILGTTTLSYNSDDVIVGSAIEIKFTNNNATDIETAAHEWGHNLGISGHSPNSSDLMYFTGNDNGNVTTSDLNTVRTAYCDVFPARSNLNRQQASGPLRTVVLH